MQPFLKKNGYTIFVCSNCGLKSTDLKEEYEAFVQQFYRSGYFTGVKAYGAYAQYQEDKPYIVRNMRKFMSQILRYKQSGKLLDVGCAMGFFVELATEEGFDAYGFDPSAYAVGVGKKVLNGRLKEGTIGSVRYPTKTFDAITLLDVIEHLHDPIGDLHRLSRYLKDDGIIVIATGNTESTTAKLLARRWPFYTPPQHLFYFTKETFTRTLEAAGFIPIAWFGIGKWLSLRYILHLARTNSESRIGNVLYALVQNTQIGRLPLYLAMGDNMAVIAKKGKTIRK